MDNVWLALIISWVLYLCVIFYLDRRYEDIFLKNKRVDNIRFMIVLGLVIWTFAMIINSLPENRIQRDWEDLDEMEKDYLRDRHEEKRWR